MCNIDKILAATGLNVKFQKKCLVELGTEFGTFTSFNCTFYEKLKIPKIQKKKKIDLIDFFCNP